MAYKNVHYGTIDYVLLATVPLDAVLSASTEVQDQIDASVVTMIIVFAFVMFVFSFLMIVITYFLVETIVEPIKGLSAVLSRVIDDDLTVTVPLPSTASSRDIKVLLEAFSNLIVALRFGSESYALGNSSRAHGAFVEALELYTVTGISIC